jgi:hypothetical protein
VEVIAAEGGTFAFGINPDGIFIFHPEAFKFSGIDTDFAEEICEALESALNSHKVQTSLSHYSFMFLMR